MTGLIVNTLTVLASHTLLVHSGELASSTGSVSRTVAIVMIRTQNMNCLCSQCDKVVRNVCKSLVCWRPPSLTAAEQHHLLGNSQFVVCFTLSLLKFPKGEKEGAYLEICFLENLHDLVGKILEKSFEDPVLVSLVALAVQSCSVDSSKLW